MLFTQFASVVGWINILGTGHVASFQLLDVDVIGYGQMETLTFEGFVFLFLLSRSLKLHRSKLLFLLLLLFVSLRTAGVLLIEQVVGQVQFHEVLGRELADIGEVGFDELSEHGVVVQIGLDGGGNVIWGWFFCYC